MKYVHVLDGWDATTNEAICKVYAERDDAIAARDRLFKRRGGHELYVGVSRKRVR